MIFYKDTAKKLCLSLCSKIGVTNVKAKSYDTDLKLCSRKIFEILAFLGYRLQAFSFYHSFTFRDLFSLQLSDTVL